MLGRQQFVDADLTILKYKQMPADTYVVIRCSKTGDVFLQGLI